LIDCVHTSVGDLRPVEKVQLLIESNPDDTFLVASCSACDTRFSLPGNTLGHKELLRKKFEIHCRGAHPEADCGSLSLAS
jgi:hypothetical protein